MTPAEATRPVLIAAAASLALMAGGCGSQDQGQGRFEALADHVAAIDVPLHPAAGARRTGAETGLRPAPFSPVKLAVMDPHDMWDARDAQAGAVIEQALDDIDRVVQEIGIGVEHQCKFRLNFSKFIDPNLYQNPE